MSKENLLKEYKENVKTLIKRAKRTGLNYDQIRDLFNESFINIKTASNSRQKSQGKVVKTTLFIAFFCTLLLYVLLYVHTPTSSIVLRNVQGLTYRTLKIVRTVSVPVIKLFPSLTVTDLYDESCLVDNPYFYLSDMDCSPCKNIHSVIDLSGIEGIDVFEKVWEGTPFIVKTNQHELSFENVQELYKNYETELSSDLRRVKMVNSNLKSLSELSNATEGNLSSDLHIQMRFNKMVSARIIRKLFPKPYFLPERSGQAVERFLNIDGPTADAYTLPNPECSFVFLIQGAGERTVVLKPPKECEKQCKTVSVLMRPSYALLYNWWYWRPISLPGKNNSNVSISYINSSC